MLLLLCILFYFGVCFYWQIRVDLFLSCCFVALFSFIVYFCVLILFPQKQQKFIQFPPFSQQTQTHKFYIYTIFFLDFFLFLLLFRAEAVFLAGDTFFLVSFACAFFLILQKFLLSIASNSIYNFFNIFFWITLAYLLIFFQKTLYFINNFIYIQIYLHLF